VLSVDGGIPKIETTILQDDSLSTNRAKSIPENATIRKEYIKCRKEICEYDSAIKRIFLVLDNVSIHRSKKVRQILLLRHPRITRVFLPTKSPDLNLIEVRWMWLQRRAINNNTFKSESDIGEVVQDWTTNYNQTHMKTITNILHKELIYSFT
jgi:DDE superfamily endonuclease